MFQILPNNSQNSQKPDSLIDRLKNQGYAKYIGEETPEKNVIGEENFDIHITKDKLTSLGFEYELELSDSFENIIIHPELKKEIRILDERFSFKQSYIRYGKDEIKSTIVISRIEASLEGQNLPLQSQNNAVQTGCFATITFLFEGKFAKTFGVSQKTIRFNNLSMSELYTTYQKEYQKVVMPNLIVKDFVDNQKQSLSTALIEEVKPTKTHKSNKAADLWENFKKWLAK